MKVLVVCQFYYPEPFSITDVASELVRQGHDVLVVTGKPNYGYRRIVEGYEKVTDEVIDGVRVHRCNLKPRKKGRLSIIQNYLSFWWNSKRYLKRLDEKFDVVYSMSLSPLISIVGGTLYARKHGVRHVLHCLDLWPESTVVTGAVKKDSLMYRVLFRWCKKIYSNLDEILVSSPSFEGYFRNVLGVTQVPIAYLPQPPQVAKADSPIVYSNRYNLVYAGNIGTLQLVEPLVEAIELVKDEIDIKLHLLGMGTRSDAVKELIETRHLEEHVEFYGVRPRKVVSDFYVNATAIVVPLTHRGTVGDTIPSKLNSSLVFGKPILGVIQGDGRRILEEAGGSVLSDGETKEDIAEAIRELVALTDDQRKELGERNLRYFDKHYRLSHIVEKLVEHLKGR